MARKPRLHIPGGLYHVMLRGNGGQSIFFGEADRQYFETLIAEGITRFGHQIHAYCWMTNHVHLALQVHQIPLSKIMQNLSFRYTRWLNRQHGRTGHVFQGRYKALLVDADAYLLPLIRYIHLNPVRAGLVQDPFCYRWSSHRAYLGQDGVEWLTSAWVLSLFADTVPIARQRYAQFVAEGLQEGHRQDFHQGTTHSLILGDDVFINDALKASQQESLVRLTPHTIIAAVCAQRQLDLRALQAADRSWHLAETRASVAYLAVETGAATLTTIGALVHRDVATLSHAVRRLRNKLVDHAELRQEVVRIEEQLRRRADDITG
ncbi:MAG: transposase [Candidatus Tectomicrobia bacterium]|nr:transposase [Candidatus Tectomicrobia bacterium]